MNTENAESHVIETIEGYEIGIYLPKMKTKVYIKEGLASDAEEAMTMQGKGGSYFQHLIRMLTVHEDENGQIVPFMMHEITTMKLSDYQLLFGEFSKINF